MNKIIIGVSLAALLVITGIVVYQFMQQQSISEETKTSNRMQEFSDCLSKFGKFMGPNETECKL